MGTRLYVGNLSYELDEQGLRQVFEADGRKVVEAKVVIDRETRRSRGFGFVEMATEDEARAAIQALDGTELDGRRLTVNEAREREPRGGGGFRAGRRDR